MQFYRRWYTNNEIRTTLDNNVITGDLSNWGFVELDGSPIKQKYDSDQWGNSDALQFHWRYNTDLSTSFAWASPPGTSGVIGGMRCKGNGWNWDGVDRRCSYYAGSNNQSLIFFPLRNRGFYLTSSFTEIGGTTAAPPPLIGLYGHQRNTATENSAIGLISFYNNINNEFNCIWFNGEGRSDSVYSSNFIGLQSRGYRWTALLFDGKTTEYTPGNYQYDYRNNICTLIKYPYGQGFLSNLFLITTTPLAPIRTGDNLFNTGLYNKFFSFGGRNFYCPVFNLAIELPAN